MEKLGFFDLEDFCEEISCRFDNLNSDDFEDISIIAKYEEAKIIIEELICDGFAIHALEIHDKEWEGYEAEYIITLCSIDDDYELFCEPMMRDGKYVKDSSTEIYILDNCSSKVIPYCYSDKLYEVAIDDEDYDGLDIEDSEDDEEEFQCEHCRLDKCAYCGDDDSKCDDTEDKDVKDKNAYTIDVKCNIDTDEAEKIIADMEKCVERMHDMFVEMDAFRRIFRW